MLRDNKCKSLKLNSESRIEKKLQHSAEQHGIIRRTLTLALTNECGAISTLLRVDISWMRQHRYEHQQREAYAEQCVTSG